MGKQLIIIADMEGASGIVDYTRDDKSAIWPEDIHPELTKWKDYGRYCITSDVLAVCNAANDYGIDDIMLYDSHYAGCKEFNVMLEQLPSNVRVFDVPERRFFWRRIRGQAVWEPFGLITVGSHAMNHIDNAYFAHSIQTPPIDEILLNGKPIGEVSMGVLNFHDVPYIANIGCAGSHEEVKALSSNVSCITVKDKSIRYEPTYQETYPIIYKGVKNALEDYANKGSCEYDEPCEFKISLCDGFTFEIPEHISWKGTFASKTAIFEAPTVEIGFELLDMIRGYIREA